MWTEKEEQRSHKNKGQRRDGRKDEVVKKCMKRRPVKWIRHGRGEGTTAECKMTKDERRRQREEKTQKR